jgi:prevent-host-death family protein
MAKTIGAREFKTRLGTYLRRVQRGATLIVTERGRPVAEVRPIVRADDENARLDELVVLGFLARTSEGPIRSFEPIRVKGRSVSQVLAEDREDRI